jgi:putative membrane protein
MNFRQLTLLSLAAAVFVAGSIQAQTPPTFPSPQTQPRDQQPTTPGNPDATSPRYPGSIPDTQGQPMDPLASEKRFVNDAAESGQVQVEVSKLAQEKGSTEAVKQFGKRLVDDHIKASQDLTQAATAANIAVPSETARKAKKSQEKLSKLSGADFDRAYTKLMMNELKDEVKSFDRESRNGKIPQIKDFAAKTLPALQEHRRMVEQLASANGKKGPEASNQ